MNIPAAVRGVIYLVIGFPLFFWIYSKLIALDSALGISLPGFLAILGFLLLIGGLLVVLYSGMLTFTQGQGSSDSFDSQQELITEGPYEIVRNPMMIGLIGIFFGISFTLSSLVSFIFAIIMSFVIHLFVIHIEEPGLEKRFGQKYIDYSLKVHRWIPKFKN
jgi:protein-S-isoprenylcysteine O-methyltransferase Ste14